MNNSSLDLLYVEDDPLAIRLLVEACQASRHPVRVRAAQDKEEAVAALSDGRTETGDGQFDLLLLSLELTPVRGLVVLEHVREYVDMQSLPVVLFSNSDDTDEVTEVAENGVDAVVQKPPTFADLVQVVETLVEVHQRTGVAGTNLRPDIERMHPKQV